MSLRRRIAAASFAAVLGAVGAASLLSAGTAAAAAPANVGTAKATSVATLKIIKPGASVRRKGKTEFKAVKDGAKLRVGDTIKTDGTGFVEVQYTDESYTRLDINSTFTINSLTDDQGNRKIEGSLDSGRAWNRTSALTESESFEQKGAGATAAVVGTAFSFACDTVGHCTLTTVINGVQWSTADGETKLLSPLQECDATAITATNSDLCTAPADVSEAAILANAWIMGNLDLDVIAGFEGLTFTGEIVVVGGQVVSVTFNPPPGSPPGTPPTTIVVAPLQPPVIDPDKSIACDGDCDNGALDITSLLPPLPHFDPGSEIVVYDLSNGLPFVINVTSSPSGPWYVVFDKTPDLVGTIYLPGGSCSEDEVSVCSDADEVELDTRYDGATVFTFVPFDNLFGGGMGSLGDYCGPTLPGSVTDTMEFHAEVGPESAPVVSEPVDPVSVTVVEATVV